MRCEAFAQELADLPPISFNFEALTNEQVIKKVRKVLQVCWFANIVINKQNDVIMKYMDEMLVTGTSRSDDATAPASFSDPTPASYPNSIPAKNTLASIMKTMHP